jgi:hypothetical protein
MSVCIGISLFTLTFLLAYLHLNYKFSLGLLKWLVLPTLGYGITIGFNSFVQSVSCGFINIKQIALGSLPVLGAIFGFLFLTLMSFVKSPVISAVPPNLRFNYGEIFALSFYMFWAGMFGESLSSGFAQSCTSR